MVQMHGPEQTKYSSQKKGVSVLSFSLKASFRAVGKSEVKPKKKTKQKKWFAFPKPLRQFLGRGNGRAVTMSQLDSEAQRFENIWLF